ncbi:TetR/AcrR family transcriptional regulator [Acuticoccus kandeliae]|uniref:TetR/AcrR family transcriptional regulator n=1 Tax=Acuticoccus kandeliae TaxID=2073160 RepID=UPI000D3E6C62|nr:TetR/AcrR family transcriptional regulator [Acuticoccus kandeliae]
MSDTADRIIEATMRLLAERPFERVTVGDIADEAGVSLATLAAHFPTRGAILDGFARKIDQAVLRNDVSDMADEPPRERLFDVLMGRLDALRPYRAAMKSLMRSALRDPSLAMGLNTLEVRSQSWMLAAAGISAAGWRGRVVLQGLAVAFARVLRIFVDEEDTGLPRTMAALDKELREAERRHKRFARVFGAAVGDASPASADGSDGAEGGWPEDGEGEGWASGEDDGEPTTRRVSPGADDRAMGGADRSEDQPSAS